jgi:hippurate hydrolase
MELNEQIRSLAEQYHQDTVSCRRHLHAHPELSFQETETQKFIEQKLLEYGVKEQQRLAGTGVVALIRGKATDQSSKTKVQSEKTVAQRSDMDALPIQETNNK